MTQTLHPTNHRGHAPAQLVCNYRHMTMACKDKQASQSRHQRPLWQEDKGSPGDTDVLCGSQYFNNTLFNVYYKTTY